MAGADGGAIALRLPELCKAMSMMMRLESITNVEEAPCRLPPLAFRTWQSDQHAPNQHPRSQKTSDSSPLLLFASRHHLEQVRRAARDQLDDIFHRAVLRRVAKLVVDAMQRGQRGAFHDVAE